MPIPTYEELRSWRDLCEYLDAQWYKFAPVPNLQQECPGIDMRLYSSLGRSLRQNLWNSWTIQFIRYGCHPILMFRDSRAAWRKYKNDRGWRLLPDWEQKIHFLEQVILFDRDPDALAKPWQDRIQRWQEEREAEKRKRFEQDREFYMNRLREQRDRFDSGRCWNCNAEIVLMMLDCPNCSKAYEDYNYLAALKWYCPDAIVSSEAPRIPAVAISL